MLLVDIFHALLEWAVLRELNFSNAIICMARIDLVILDRVVLNFTWADCIEICLFLMFEVFVSIWMLRVYILDALLVWIDLRELQYVC